jgi:endoglucanase
MSGGTCEATAYQLDGYRAAALCVALGNYHNCGPDETIAPEFVAVDDVAGMIALMLAAVLTPASADPLVALRARLEKGLTEYRRYW